MSFSGYHKRGKGKGRRSQKKISEREKRGEAGVLKGRGRKSRRLSQGGELFSDPGQSQPGQPRPSKIDTVQFKCHFTVRSSTSLLPSFALPKTLLPRLIHEAQRRVKLHTLNRAPPEPQSAWPTLRGGASASGPSASMDSCSCCSSGKNH